MSNLTELGSAVTETLKSGSASDMLREYAEVGLDAALSDGLLKDLPFVSTIVAFSKLGISISDRMLIKKLVKFLGPLHHLPAAERQEMIQKLEADPAYGRKVGEHLLEILDRIESHQKPEMIALVLKAYAKGEVEATMLHRLNVAIERLPSFEIAKVRVFQGMTEEQRSTLNVETLQALMGAGLANVASGWGSLVYQPSEVCNAFVRLNLDRASA